MPFYLAIKEMFRNKIRFISVSTIVALITLLVLFLVSMAEGLSLAYGEYIKNIDAELMLFRENVNTSISLSSLGRSKLNDIKRVEGVEAVGAIGFSMASIILNGNDELEKVDVSLIGVEPGMPGAPSVFAGRTLNDERAEEVIIDQHVLDKINIPVGSSLNLKVLQGAEEEIYSLTVVGHTTGKKYNIPSIFVPLRVWDKIKPQEKPGGGGEIIFNVAAVKLKDPEAIFEMAAVIEGQVSRIETTELATAYESAPGYKEMESIIVTMQNFIIFVALLVIGGFFQIQTLQKIAQIGMLKAIGASNKLIALTLIIQVTLTTTIGIIVGIAAVLGVIAALPPEVPILFNGPKVITAIIMLLFMGPIASFFSVRTLLKVEPLKALGLGI